MPFKCATCNKIVHNAEDQDCNCENPRFRKCAMIHFIHEEAPGPIYTRALKEQKNSTLISAKSRLLRLGCTTKKPQESVSFIPSLVSCPVCMTFAGTIQIPKTEPKSKEQSLNLDKIDISEEEAAILNIPVAPPNP